LMGHLAPALRAADAPLREWVVTQVRLRHTANARGMPVRAHHVGRSVVDGLHAAFFTVVIAGNAIHLVVVPSVATHDPCALEKAKSSSFRGVCETAEYGE
jgi:hypothetical protein